MFGLVFVFSQLCHHCVWSGFCFWSTLSPLCLVWFLFWSTLYHCVWFVFLFLVNSVSLCLVWFLFLVNSVITVFGLGVVFGQLCYHCVWSGFCFWSILSSLCWCGCCRYRSLVPMLSTCSLAEDVKTVALQAGCEAVAGGDRVVTA